MKNLLIIFCMAFFLISQTPSVSAVTKDSNSHNFIFVDIPNPGGLIGISFGISHFYDTIRLAGTTLPYFLTGFTGIGKAIMTPSNVFSMPLMIGICFGRQNCLELDAGLSIEYWDTRELPLESRTRNAIKPVAMIGYRYQRAAGGFIFRTGMMGVLQIDKVLQGYYFCFGYAW